MPTARLPDINSSFLRHRGEFLDAARLGDDRRALAAFHARNALLPADIGADGLPTHRVMISDSIYRERHRHTLVATCPGCGAKHSRKSLRILAVRQPASARFISGQRTARMWRCQPSTLLPSDHPLIVQHNASLERESDKAALDPDEDEAAVARAAKSGDDGDRADPEEAGDRADRPPGAQAPRRRSRKKPAAVEPTTCGILHRLAKTEVIDSHPTEPFLCGVVPPPPKRPPGLAGRTPFVQAFQKWAALAHAEMESRSAEYRDVHWKRGNEDEDDMLGALGSLFKGRSLEDESGGGGGGGTAGNAGGGGP